MLKRIICRFRGHIQAWETVTAADGKDYRVGFCARCRCGLYTFDPPLIVPGRSTVSIPIGIINK